MAGHRLVILSYSRKRSTYRLASNYLAGARSRSRRLQLQLTQPVRVCFGAFNLPPGARSRVTTPTNSSSIAQSTRFPPTCVRFFDASRAELLNQVNVLLFTVAKTPPNVRTHFWFLEKYGRFPFELIRVTQKPDKAAVNHLRQVQTRIHGRSHGRSRLQRKLTEAMQDREMGRRTNSSAARPGLYVAVRRTHDPLNTTDNIDGHLARKMASLNVSAPQLVDRYSSFFLHAPRMTHLIADPTYRPHAFEAACLSHMARNNFLRRRSRSRRTSTLTQTNTTPLSTTTPAQS